MRLNPNIYISILVIFCAGSLYLGCATNEPPATAEPISEVELDFQLVYSQVFLLGGYGAGLQEFEPGQGVVWQVQGENNGTRYDNINFTAERTLLSRQADGSSWWYLAYRPADSTLAEYEYEFLLDDDFQVKKARYLHPTAGPQQIDLNDPQHADESIAYNDIRRTWGGTLRQISRAMTRVRIPAGLYNAELIVYHLRAPELENERIYRWWVNETVPGELIKFEWHERDGSILRGEIQQIHSNRTTGIASL